MPVTMKEVRKFLDCEEPAYSEAMQLGDEALPFLDKLVKGANPMLAAKAVYLASMIGQESAMPILKAAASSADMTVRVAAAAAAINFPAEQVGDVLMELVQDADPGIRKTAMKSISFDAPEALRVAVERMSQNDENSAVRGAALRTMRRIAGESESEESAALDAEILGIGMGGGSVDFLMSPRGDKSGGGNAFLTDFGSGDGGGYEITGDAGDGGGSDLDGGTGQGGGSVE